MINDCIKIHRFKAGRYTLRLEPPSKLSCSNLKRKLSVVELELLKGRTPIPRTLFKVLANTKHWVALIIFDNIKTLLCILEKRNILLVTQNNDFNLIIK